MCRSVLLCIFIIYICFSFKFTFQNDLLRRQKRLIWPEGASRMQFILGLGIPVDLKRETVIIGVFLKANYKMPMNGSIYKYPGPIFERKQRSTSRWSIYNYLSQEAQLRGHGGRSCVLRAVCEAADIPIDDNYGLFDEIFHTMFTPTSTIEELSHHTDNEYYAAQNLGKKYKGKCAQFFPDCKKTFLEMFTRPIDFEI